MSKCYQQKFLHSAPPRWTRMFETSIWFFVNIWPFLSKLQPFIMIHNPIFHKLIMCPLKMYVVIRAGIKSQTTMVCPVWLVLTVKCLLSQLETNKICTVLVIQPVPRKIKRSTFNKEEKISGDLRVAVLYSSHMVPLLQLVVVWLSAGCVS